LRAFFQKSASFFVNYWLAALVGLTALRLILADSIPLSPDETYYWVWSVNLQPGYFDHPPMVAYWIRAGTFFAGNTALGVRLVGPVAAALGSILLWDAGENFLPRRHAGLIAAALFNATIILAAGAIVMTPDTPLVFFWTAAIAALGRLYASRDARWWLAVGAATGLALLSKYTAILLVVCIFLWLVTRRDGRAALRTPWPWAGVALAAALFAPDFLWNAAHHWVSFRKQGGRVEGFDLSRSADFLAELVMGQIGLVTPIIFALAAAGLWRIRKLADGGAQLLLWLTLLPAAVFLEHVISGRVESNWPAIMLPSAFLAAAYLPEPAMKRWLTPALALGFALSAVTYAQALAHPIPMPADQDPSALQLAGWQDFAAQIAARAPAYVTSDEYTVLSELVFYTPATLPIVGFDKRWWVFSLPRSGIAPGATGIFITRRKDAPCPVPLGTAARTRSGQVIATFRLCQFTAFPKMYLLPHP
jgi:4-amino-4-deoxy-L-arabinose transferase-like glycosyltransferase